MRNVWQPPATSDVDSDDGDDFRETVKAMMTSEELECEEGRWQAFKFVVGGRASTKEESETYEP